jgi:hypothetical protein
LAASTALKLVVAGIPEIIPIEVSKFCVSSGWNIIPQPPLMTVCPAPSGL